MAVTALTWYGEDPVWSLLLDRPAAATYGRALNRSFETGVLTYSLEGLTVLGDDDKYSVMVRFYENPPYPTFGLEPFDFPRIYVTPSLTSIHRHPDDALCLYHPHDPLQNRWTSELGLLSLMETTRVHLFMENYWRKKKIWLLEDAPHGFSRRRSA